jgi:hypothetical protein
MLSKLPYWSGYTGILGGLLFAVAVVLHPLRDGMSVFNSGLAYGAVPLGLGYVLLGFKLRSGAKTYAAQMSYSS